MDSVAMAKVTVIVVALAMAMAVHPMDVIAAECSGVEYALNYCKNFLSTGGKVGIFCCRSLKIVVQGQEGKACNCLKAHAQELPAEEQPNAAALSKSCDLPLPDITPTMDCSNVN